MKVLWLGLGLGTANADPGYSKLYLVLYAFILHSVRWMYILLFTSDTVRTFIHSCRLYFVTFTHYFIHLHYVSCCLSLWLLIIIIIIILLSYSFIHVSYWISTCFVSISIAVGLGTSPLQFVLVFAHRVQTWRHLPSISSSFTRKLWVDSPSQTDLYIYTYCFIFLIIYFFIYIYIYIYLHLSFPASNYVLSCSCQDPSIFLTSDTFNLLKSIFPDPRKISTDMLLYIIYNI